MGPNPMTGAFIQEKEVRIQTHGENHWGGTVKM